MFRLTSCLVVLAGALAATDVSRADITYDDGGVHTIDAWTSGQVHVLDSPTGDPTTLNILPGAVLEQHLYLRDTSNVVMSGGTIQGHLSLRKNTSEGDESH